MASINTPEEVMAAEQEPGAVFLDVRGEDEVKAESLQSRPYKQAKCSLDDCSELMSKAETLMSDKNGEVRCTQFLCHGNAHSSYTNQLISVSLCIVSKLQ